MFSWVGWSILSLALLSAGFATLDTDKLLAVAHGVAQSGLLEEKKPYLAMIPSPAISQPLASESHDRQTRAQMDAFVSEIEQLWTSDAQLSSPSVLVQYSQDKRSRSLIDLKEGKLIVEHLDSPDAQLVMHRVLSHALLTPDDPRQVDLLSMTAVSDERQPFLLGQLVDSLGKPIDSLSRAQTFAAWAIVHKLKWVDTPNGRVHRIELALDANHKQVRAARFAGYIEAAAVEFGVDANLLYAIAETESHFNPFAISPSGALGIMQIMPERAGKDAMKWLTGISRAPTQVELTDPHTNIRLGAAYVALLSDHYLKQIEHPNSREYAVIAAYNGGASRAMSVFSDRKDNALSTINALTPQMVYDLIKTRHASAETRGYIEKVTRAKHRYSNRV
jgi:membrane-bound lytic murein transglycosylase C